MPSAMTGTANVGEGTDPTTLHQLAERESVNHVAKPDVLLSVRGLSIAFEIGRGRLQAVEDVSFDIRCGEVFALVGESGSGKSTVALALVGLLPRAGAVVDAGRVLFGDQDLLAMSEPEWRRLRGGSVGVVFQDPMTSLNPTMTVGDQVAEPLRIHRRLEHGEARSHALAMLEKVGIPQAKRRLDDYPHQLSGGMRQRVMIAMALVCEPALLIADEPTTALDVTIQAQILDLIQEACTRVGTAVLLITHDLGVAARMCDHVGVMYASRLVEVGCVERVFRASAMPYTRGLLRAIPHLGVDLPRRLPAIPGTPPNLLDPPAGCRFAPRCALVRTQCEAAEPHLVARAPGHLARCWGSQSDGWIR